MPFSAQKSPRAWGYFGTVSGVSDPTIRMGSPPSCSREMRLMCDIGAESLPRLRRAAEDGASPGPGVCLEDAMTLRRSASIAITPFRARRAPEVGRLSANDVRLLTCEASEDRSIRNAPHLRKTWVEETWGGGMPSTASRRSAPVSLVG